MKQSPKLRVMEAIDTNVLVRIATKDDEKQLQKASALLRGRFSSASPAWVSIVVTTELAWVLGTLYKYSREEICTFVENLSNADRFQLEDANAVLEALHLFRTSSADFADCLILVRNLSRKIQPTHTFDRKASRLDGFQAI